MTRGQDSGRHRRGGSPLAWTPRTNRRERAAHSDTESDNGPDNDADTEVIPVVDDFPDAPASGLAKFNLGSIPASVSPPRSWRRAAWFAVGASALVLVGLVFAAMALVTAPRKPDVVDALPGLPTAPSLATAPTEEPVREPLPDEATTTTRAAPDTAVPTSRATVPQEPPARPPSTAGGQAPPALPSAATSSARPPRTTVSSPMLVPPPETDAELMGDRTEEYYQQVAADPDAAYEMTTGPLRREGPESIERRYAGVDRVEVTAITIDPGRGTTRSRLRVVREDGSVSTVERELTFTYGDDPMISGDSAAS